MGVPVVYRRTGEPIISSFDSTDVASGVGEVTYYLGNFDGSNIINRSTFYSWDYIVGGLLPGTQGDASEIDYDLLIEKTLSIKGTAIATFTLGVGVVGGGTSAEITVKLRKWDGTTETEIANATSDTVTASGGNIYSLGLTITNKINFKRGDYIRLTVIVSGYKGSGAGEYGYGCDPANRTSDENTLDTSASTQFTLKIPYLIKA